MAIVTGVVEAKTGLGKYGTYGILVAGNWYNSKFEIKCNKGDTVEFDNGDKKYVNKLKVVGSGGVASPAGGDTGTTGTSKPYAPRGGFPIGPLDGQRSIIRQNAVTNANNLIANLLTAGDKDAADALKTGGSEFLIAVAQCIEDYTTGDMDTKEAESKVKDAKKDLEDSM